jgi:hypothetical protein
MVNPKKPLPDSINPKQYSLPGGLTAAEEAEIKKLLGNDTLSDLGGYDEDAVEEFVAGKNTQKGWGAAPGARCHTSHKPLPLGEGLVIRGGSCSSPIEGMDIYVGFDHSMTRHKRAWPWVAGEAFLFPIQDMSAPSDAGEFKSLINYLEASIRAGKKVHCGCIGGHGRTGTVFAALAAQMMGEKNAIQYVREHYCKKAVESKSQVAFLMKHYGVNNAEGTKADYGGGYGQKTATKAHTGPQSFKALQANFCLWGPTATISI